MMTRSRKTKSLGVRTYTNISRQTELLRRGLSRITRIIRVCIFFFYYSINQRVCNNGKKCKKKLPASVRNETWRECYNVHSTPSICIHTIRRTRNSTASACFLAPRFSRFGGTRRWRRPRRFAPDADLEKTNTLSYYNTEIYSVRAQYSVAFLVVFRVGGRLFQTTRTLK